jgi:hypothetical protein
VSRSCACQAEASEGWSPAKNEADNVIETHENAVGITLCDFEPNKSRHAMKRGGLWTS